MKLATFAKRIHDLECKVREIEKVTSVQSTKVAVDSTSSNSDYEAAQRVIVEYNSIPFKNKPLNFFRFVDERLHSAEKSPRNVS